MGEINYGSFKQAAHYRAGRIAPIRLIVVHATAGQESGSGTGAENVQSMFASSSSRVASAHVTADQNSIARSVHDGDTAFGAAHANACGLHVEQVGLTDQNTAQWEDAISKATITNTARVVRDWCGLYRIDKRILSVAEVKAILSNPGSTQLSGITFHADVEHAMPSTGHTDPGPGYPRDLLLQLVNAGAAPAPAARSTNPYINYAGPCHRAPENQGGVVRFVQWALGKPCTGVFDDDLNGAIRSIQNKHGQPVTGAVGDDHDWTLHYLKGLTR